MCHIAEPNELPPRTTFNNFLLNVRSILPANNASVRRRQSVNDENASDECAVMFIQRSQLRAASPVQRLGFIRSYINKLMSRENSGDADPFMLPRVYGARDWDAIELRPEEKYIDDLDNVLDKFTRVISVCNNSEIPSNLFNVIRRAIRSDKPKLIGIFSFLRRRGMIARRFAGGWRWEQRMTICRKWRRTGRSGSPASSRDSKAVSPSSVRHCNAAKLALFCTGQAKTFRFAS